VSHAAAIVAPLDTLIAGAQIAIPSKYEGSPLREHHALSVPPPEQPTNVLSYLRVRDAVIRATRLAKATVAVRSCAA
jgi:hypothetical protein